MKSRTDLIGLVAFGAALVAIQSHAASRGIRTDDPGGLCNSGNWAVNSTDTDFNATMDGNGDGSQNPSLFFNPGTVIGPPAFYCVPNLLPLSALWANDANDYPNPASMPMPASTGYQTPTIVDLTAVDAYSDGVHYGAIMYYWPHGPAPSEFTSDDPNNWPSAEVIVWTLRASSYSPAHGALTNGGLELEFDNWCSPNNPNDFSGGVPPPSSAAPSLTWNGNYYLYTAACGQDGNNFNGDDLILNPSGVLIGYVDLTNVTTFGSEAPGWAVQYQTASTLVLSPTTAASGAPISFQATVAAPNGAPTPTGTVNFFVGETFVGSSTLNRQGVATFPDTGLAVGTYSVSAAYVGVPLTFMSPGIPTGPTSIATQSYFFASNAPAQHLTVLPTEKARNVVGLTAPAAAIAIKDASLVVGTVTHQSNMIILPGIVISQSPLAGDSVAKGAAVRLVVSSGSTCADLNLEKAAFGSKRGQPGYRAIADINSDGVVNIKDLSAVERALPAGTVCH